MVGSDVRPNTEVRPNTVTTATTPRRLAVVTALGIALLYGAIYLGVVSVGRSEAGDLAVLGVAGLLFLVIALVLWRVSSRLVWIGVIVLQFMMAAMYVAIAPEREPPFEVWGLAIRGLSAVLVVALVWSLLDLMRGGPNRRPGDVGAPDVDPGGGS